MTDTPNPEWDANEDDLLGNVIGSAFGPGGRRGAIMLKTNVGLIKQRAGGEAARRIADAMT